MVLKKQFQRCDKCGNEEAFLRYDEDERLLDPNLSKGEIEELEERRRRSTLFICVICNPQIRVS